MWATNQYQKTFQQHSPTDHSVNRISLLLVAIHDLSNVIDIVWFPSVDETFCDNIDTGNVPVYSSLIPLS